MKYPKLFTTAALITGLVVAALPADANIGIENYLSNRDHLLTYCAAYDAGVPRDELLAAGKETYKRVLPDSYWNLPGFTVNRQAALLTLSVNDTAISYYCPRHINHLGTEYEWNVLFTPDDDGGNVTNETYLQLPQIY